MEVKASAHVGHNATKPMRTFLQEYRDRALGGLLLHGGEETFWVSDGVLAAPWWKVI